MLISHSKKFIFVHNYKVAGKSIEAAFKEYKPWYHKDYIGFFSDKIGRLLDSYKLKQFPQHAKAIEIKNELPDSVWDEYYSFAFVRNPWSWQVSLYFYMKQTESHYQHEIIKSMDSFEEYIEWRVEEDKHLQKEYFTDENDNIIVDHIGKLENIEKEIEQISKEIGLDKVPKLPHKNKSDHKDYREYYNEYTRELVRKYFKEDIELFNYTFE